jgi:hypothetical protein
MINELVIGTAVIIIVVFMTFCCPILILVGLGMILFGLLAYLIGATIRICMPRGR